MKDDLIDNPEALQPDYIPPEFVDRNRERTGLARAFSDIADGTLGNLHISGPHGTGKTHLTHETLEELPSKINSPHISCTQHDTQYKALKQLYSAVTGEDVESGHHTSKLQRQIKKRTTHVPTIVVLDDIEFLLLNDGNDLLYYLSRLGKNISVVTISSNQTDLHSELEERTYSSLQPQSIAFDSYDAKQAYQILADRARTALTPQSLHRDALTYISSRTRNISLGLHWLQTAAERATNSITVDTIKEVQSTARRRYVDHLLDDFTPHHELLFQAMTELTTENKAETTLQTGAVYDRYQDLCETYDEEKLSTRRLGDFLKQLEQLDLIDADYRYGGQKGKTREIQLNIPV
jgi:orc1/cdc6 family replication initiation protein